MAEIALFEVPSASFFNSYEVVPGAIVPRIFVLPDLGTDGYVHAADFCFCLYSFNFQIASRTVFTSRSYSSRVLSFSRLPVPSLAAPGFGAPSVPGPASYEPCAFFMLASVPDGLYKISSTGCSQSPVTSKNQASSMFCP